MPRDVVLVTIDALRADHVGFSAVEPPPDPADAAVSGTAPDVAPRGEAVAPDGPVASAPPVTPVEPGRVPPTPTLDGFAAGGLVCERAFAGGPYTRASFPSLVTGCHSWGERPERFGDRPHVAVAFGGAGYETCGVHSNPHLAAGSGYERGFDTFEDGMTADDGVVSRLREGVGKFLGTYEPYLGAERTTDRAVDWLDRTAGPRFLWVHYMDVHAPYRPREGTESEGVSNRTSQRLWNAMQSNDADRFTGPELATLRRLYRGEVEHLDDRLARLLDAVERLCDDPVVLVISDHGDLFGEDGYVGHPGHLHDALVHVPCVVSGLGTTGRLDAPVSAIDVLPTLCDAAGIEIPQGVQGRPIRSVEPGDPGAAGGAGSSAGERYVFAQSGTPGDDLSVLVTDGERSLVREIDDGASWFLDRSSGEQQPAEAAPAALAAALDDHVASIDANADRGDDAVSDAVARRLSDLGYT